MTRLAIVTTHPIQYYAPWFRYLAGCSDWQLRVVYLWDFGVREQADQKFGLKLRWDLPLLEGYDSEFVPNASRDPGTHHFWGINNPELSTTLGRFQPDAIVCLGYNYASFLRLLFDRAWRRVPKLLRGDSHRLMPRRGARAWLSRRALQVLFRRFEAFLTVGQANRAYLRLHGVPGERIFFSPHAVDNDRFMADAVQVKAAAGAWRQELGIDDQQAVILFAGKMEAKKRPLDLLRAFRKAQLSNTVLLFVGNGALEHELRREAAGGNDIRFAPFQNQTLMPRTYAAAEVVVLPSYGPSETWGLCINEAQCLARPVIVSDHVGCAADLVQHEKTGLVFPAGDVDALARCLRLAFADRHRLRSWGQAGKCRVSEYSYEKATDGLREALHFLKV